MRPYLVVSVDTEEEGLWGGHYPRHGFTVRNVSEGVPRFQELCDRLYLRPVYLVDYAVVDDDRAAGTLEPILRENRCEIGSHLHPWCNPPHAPYEFPRDSYWCNLPDELMGQKLRALTDAVVQRFGEPPVSFRAGRYGLDVRGARWLVREGYRVDSSVVPFSSFTTDGGPDYSEAPWQPYWLRPDDAQSVVEPFRDGQLLEVPVTVGYSRFPFGWRHRLRQRLERSWLRHVKAVGIVDRLGVAQRVKLSPEQADARRMIALLEAGMRQGGWCYVMMFHSSSLLPGQSPYVRDKAELEAFLATIEETVTQARARGVCCVTFKELLSEVEGEVLATYAP